MLLVRFFSWLWLSWIFFRLLRLWKSVWGRVCSWLWCSDIWCSLWRLCSKLLGREVRLLECSVSIWSLLRFWKVFFGSVFRSGFRVIFNICRWFRLWKVVVGRVCSWVLFSYSFCRLVIFLKSIFGSFFSGFLNRVNRVKLCEWRKRVEGRNLRWFLERVK